MPLHAVYEQPEGVRLYVWRIEESYTRLFQQVALTDRSLSRLEGMKSESHQRGFLAVRALLQSQGYTDFDLSYTPEGKPQLQDATPISISHSYGYSVIALSSCPVGIDIELRRDTLLRIGRKFANEAFVWDEALSATERMRLLAVLWGAKESVFKLCNEPGISFKDHIQVHPFDMNQQKARVALQWNGLQQEFPLYFTEIDQYTLTWLHS